MARDAARAKVERDISAVLPDRLATAGTWIWAVETERRRVGTAYVGIRGGEAWLYDITIDPDERGKG